MASLESSLLIRLIDRVTGPSRSVSRVIGDLQRRSNENAQALDAMRGRMLDAAGAAYALARGIGAPVKDAIAFESAMVDVRKVVDFESPEAFQAFGRDVQALSREIPIAADGLASIVAAAGQAGIARDDLLRFTEEAAKIGVAFDISADQAGEAVAKLMTGLGLSIDEATSLADAMNHLSNSQASSAAEILDVVRRVGASATQFGFSAEETSAFASAMIAAGAQSDVAATSFQNMGRALTRGASATKRQREALGALGMDAEEVARAMQVDAVGTTRRVLEAIARLPAEMRAAVSSDYFGDEARALGPLMTNLELVDASLALVADKSEYAGSAQREFETRSGTTANALQLFQNRVRELSIAIGDSLLPALNQLLDRIGPIVSDFAELAQRFPRLTSAVVQLAVGLVGLRIATIAGRWAFLFMRGAVLDAGLAVLRTVQMVQWAVPRLRIAFLAIRFGALAGMLGMTSIVAWVGGAIAAITAPVWLAVAAIAAVGIAIHKYWEPIREFVAGFAEEIWAELSQLASDLGAWAEQKIIDVGAWLGIDEETMRAALDFAKTTIQESFRSMVDAVKSIGGEIGNFLSDIFTMNNYSEEEEAAFRERGRGVARALIDGVKSIMGAMAQLGSDLIQALWDGIQAKFAEVLEWFRTLPRRIRDAIGNIDLTDMIAWPRMPWSSEPEPAIDGARASGGPVTAGRSYLIGERGPEIFSPGRSGFISPNSTVRSLTAGGGDAVRTTGPITVNVHVRTNASPHEIGRAASQSLADALDRSRDTNLQGRPFSTGGWG